MKVFAAQGTDAIANRGAFTSETTADYRVGSSGTTVSGRRVEPAVGASRDDLSRAVIEWLEGEESRAYEGRWVILDSVGNVVAQAHRPAELPQEAMRQPGTTTLFVLPRNVRIGGWVQALPTPVSIGFDHAQQYGGAVSHRPLVAIEFAGIDAVGRLLGATTTVVLIDSGADMTMLNADFALPLGIDLSVAPIEQVTGIGGNTNARRATVLARLCGRWVPIPILFEPGRDVDLLGRAGAFEAMRLAFFHHHHLVLAAVEP